MQSLKYVMVILQYPFNGSLVHKAEFYSTGDPKQEI